MSIRIIPQEQLEKSEKNTAEQVPPLLFPRLKNLYSRRAARLRDLAAKNPLGDYLRFAAVIAQAQEIVLYDHPLQIDLHQRLAESAQQGKPPLDIHTYPRDVHWQRLLHSLIAELKPEMSGQALAVLENLEKASSTELETLASALLEGEFAQVSSDKAPFIWAALSIYWGADGGDDPRQSAGRVWRAPSVLPGVRQRAGRQRGAHGRWPAGSALSAL